MDYFKSLINSKTKLICLAHISNVTGVINPIEEIIAIANANGIYTLIDGAQASSHLKIDVQKLACTFYVFSAHKMYGPMGVGILYGRKEILEKMPPYQTGGEMISKVCFHESTFNELPFKFEAGTPMVPEIIAFSQALDFIEEIGFEAIQKHEHSLLEYATQKLIEIDGVKIIGTHPHKSAVISFVMDNIHPYDMGSLLDQFGIATRTGNHCAQPLMKHWGIPGTIRVSMAVYNNIEEIDIFIKKKKKAKQMLT